MTAPWGMEKKKRFSTTQNWDNALGVSLRQVSYVSNESFRVETQSVSPMM